MSSCCENNTPRKSSLMIIVIACFITAAVVGVGVSALLSNIILPQTAKYLIAVSRYGLERETTIGTFTITLTRES